MLYSAEIWGNEVENLTHFNVSGTVYVNEFGEYCYTDGCAMITATDPESYLETEAIDTTGYTNITLKFAFAFADGWGDDNYFSVNYYSGGHIPDD